MSDMGKRALIVLNGEIELSLPLVEQTDYELIIATDGALNTLLDSGMRPTVVLGDFDSVDDASLQQAEELGIEILHTPDQNFTDFEKALRHVESKDFTDLDVIGHTGRRLDHSLGAMHSAALMADRLWIRMLDPTGVGFIIPRDEVFVLEGRSGKVCSVIGLLPSIVNLDGFKWPLHDADLGGDADQSISNEIVSYEAVVQVIEGVVVVYLNN
jgi:thiamine pyrophosphokinase